MSCVVNRVAGGVPASIAHRTSYCPGSPGWCRGLLGSLLCKGLASWLVAKDLVLFQTQETGKVGSSDSEVEVDLLQIWLLLDVGSFLGHEGEVWLKILTRDSDSMISHQTDRQSNRQNATARHDRRYQ